MLRLAAILLFFYLIISSCERISSFSGDRLVFSNDTIYFDTVFSSVGSATRELRILNSTNRTIDISRIYLAGGNSSKFRINIDGEPSTEKKDLSIEPGDSIFIFVDVLINPGDNNSPFEVTDSIMISSNDSYRKILLLAWGQDINLIKNKRIGTETWKKGKPYLIYDKLTVDSLETLTIEAGSRVYFHRNASMIIEGTIVIQGLNDSPVILAGDRYESMYDDVPGQWKGILIKNSGTGNAINHAIIRNAVYGIQLGEAISTNDVPALKLSSCVIAHSSISGVSAINGRIDASNCVIMHCGSYCIYLGSGGDYTFNCCSLFNTWEYGLRITPSVFITEKAENSLVRISPMNVKLNNSVVYGDNVSELSIVSQNLVRTGRYYFDHCLIKLDTVNSKFWARNEYPGSIINKNPRFIESEKWDLRPDTLSPLLNNGNPDFSLLYPYDIREVSRTNNGNPDIGAFERLPGEHKKAK